MELAPHLFTYFPFLEGARELNLFSLLGPECFPSWDQFLRIWGFIGRKYCALGCGLFVLLVESEEKDLHLS